VQKLLKNISKLRSSDDLLERAGLLGDPEISTENSPWDWNQIPITPYATGRLGASVFEYNGAKALTMSCASCHAANLFGKKVLGLSHRFPRSNEFFVHGQRAMAVLKPHTFQNLMDATPEEVRLLERTRFRMQFIGAKKPATLGLDTSLAQVALSLAKRGRDPYAELDPKIAKNPRRENLAHFVADSKPAVWWTLKYKNRWLSDGSVLSGNPILTNFLWNEIGRGTDLYALESWLNENEKTIEDLTGAVFSTQAPKFTDFFPAESLSLERAMRGEKIFIARCSKCHGVYEKTWSLPGSEKLPLAQQIQTHLVRYFEDTPVHDVGTDPQRRLGMHSLEQLNGLEISKRHGILVRPQAGYVPPPLVGIWARYPYFHNNSVPTLCALLSKQKERPITYFARPANDPQTDYDLECGGYPATKGDHSLLFDTRKPGLSNRGHEFEFEKEDRKDLVQFLLTL
jgi:mono/diheme cytochrome c family protein